VFRSLWAQILFFAQDIPYNPTKRAKVANTIVNSVDPSRKTILVSHERLPRRVKAIADPPSPVATSSTASTLPPSLNIGNNLGDGSKLGSNDPENPEEMDDDDPTHWPMKFSFVRLGNEAAKAPVTSKQSMESNAADDDAGVRYFDPPKEDSQTKSVAAIDEVSQSVDEWISYALSALTPSTPTSVTACLQRLSKALETGNNKQSERLWCAYLSVLRSSPKFLADNRDMFAFACQCVPESVRLWFLRILHAADSTGIFFIILISETTIQVISSTEIIRLPLDQSVFKFQKRWCLQFPILVSFITTAFALSTIAEPSCLPSHCNLNVSQRLRNGNRLQSSALRFPHGVAILWHQRLRLL
jgi:hypothetical protein